MRSVLISSETARKCLRQRVNRSSPKAEVTGSNPVGCASFLKMPDMTKTGLLLTISILVVLGTMPIAAAEAMQPANVDAQTGASDKDKHTGTAEALKKTIDGKTYCFQNDPALTKRQGGG